MIEPSEVRGLLEDLDSARETYDEDGDCLFRQEQAEEALRDRAEELARRLVLTFGPPAYVVTEEQIEAVRKELVREGYHLWSYQGRKISSARNIPLVIEEKLQDIALWAAIARKIEEPAEALIDREAERACKALTGKSIRGYLNSEEGLGMSPKKFYDIARYVIERDEEKS